MAQETKQNTFGKWLLVALSGMLIFLFGYEKGCSRTDEPTIKTDTVIINRTDTVVIEKPTEIVRYITRYDTVRTTELVVISDTLENGQIKPSTAIIPIEMICYKDSTEKAQYKAYISGYHAALDSISINCFTTEKIITKEINHPARRIGLGVSVGYGVANSGISPYIGAGIYYRIF